MKQTFIVSKYLVQNCQYLITTCEVVLTQNARDGQTGVAL